MHLQFAITVSMLLLRTRAVTSRFDVFAKRWTIHSHSTPSSPSLVSPSTIAFMTSSSTRGGSDGNHVSPGDNHENVVLPKREYGYRKEPFTWSELVQIINVEKNLGKLSRSEEQEREYQIKMREMRTQWKSVYDNILCSKFNFEKRPFTNETHSVWQAYPPLSEIKEPRKVLVKNDFPYYNEPGIEHYVLWKIVEDVTEEDIEEAKEELRKATGCVDLLWWKNPPHLKSLPDVDHIHIIVLRKQHNRL